MIHEEYDIEEDLNEYLEATSEEEKAQEQTEEIIKEKDDLFSEEIYNENLDDKEFSIVDSLLATKGIKDAKIKIIGEDNKEEEVNFFDLSKEEQLDILTSQAPSETELGDSEAELITYLRENNLTLQDYLEKYKETIISELNSGEEEVYDIDAYDDQELYLLDLKNKFDLTDEELQAELEKELVNADLFNKKTSKLRTEYKELEEEYKKAQKLEQDAQREEQYKQFASSIGDIATSISDFHGIVIEDNEKQETLSYLLDLDDAGVSKFASDINDPKKLYEAAWYLRYGKEAFEALENAYEAEIKKLKKEDKPRVVVRNSKETIPNINYLY